MRFKICSLFALTSVWILIKYRKFIHDFWLVFTRYNLQIENINEINKKYVQYL